MPGCTPYGVTAKAATEGLTGRWPFGTRRDRMTPSPRARSPPIATTRSTSRRRRRRWPSGCGAGDRPPASRRAGGAPPEEVAAAVTTLLSDEASFITGATVRRRRAHRRHPRPPRPDGGHPPLRRRYRWPTTTRRARGFSPVRPRAGHAPARCEAAWQLSETGYLRGGRRRPRRPRPGDGPRGDLDEHHVAGLTERGIVVEAIETVRASSRTAAVDPEGNRVTFAQSLGS